MRGSIEEAALEPKHDAEGVLIDEVVEARGAVGGLADRRGRARKCGVEVDPHEFETDIDIRNRVPQGPGADLRPTEVGVAIDVGQRPLNLSEGGAGRRDRGAVVVLHTG